MNATRWDVFCRVVDNYGDAGVTWRLARQLAAEHGLEVTLWIDDLPTLARIAPSIDASRDDQSAARIRIRRWTDPLPGFDVANVVVEAFGCKLPEPYVDAMAARQPLPAWIVLEHLSAERWVDGAHGLPSPHPQRALPRRFWVPGFTAASGGLPRERGLFDARDRHRADSRATAALWTGLGVAPSSGSTLDVCLFCYPNEALPPLLDAWAAGTEPVRVLVPEGVAVVELDRWSRCERRAGHAVRRGNLELATLPFVAQDDFDRILWSCHLNFVRGEDTFVRAQWAARPFVWQAYRQSGGEHLAKVEAFLARFAGGLEGSARAATERFWRAWNGEEAAGVVAAWPAFRAALEALGRHAEHWSAELGQQPDLAAALVGKVGSGL